LSETLISYQKIELGLNETEGKEKAVKDTLKSKLEEEKILVVGISKLEERNQEILKRMEKQRIVIAQKETEINGIKNTLQEIKNWPETIEKNINPKKYIIEGKAKTKESEKNEVSPKSKEEKNRSEKKNDFVSELPEEIILEVPFTSQAPFFVWDEIHEEACEEATLVMMKYYLDGKKLDPKISENEIQNIVKYQIKKYGDYKDTDLKKTADIFLDYYGNGENYKGKKMKVIYDIKKEDLKKHLVQGNPTIVPTAGRLLKNPNFKSPGPLYHNLILIGYKNEKIIVNDPGTKKGEKYEYSIDILFEAIHDFPGKAEDIKKGRKAMIILE